MNINNLSIGMTIKNYNELCNMLDIDIKKGTCSRDAQLKEIQRYIRYHKEGHRFIIDEIYGEVKEKVDNRQLGNNNISYIEYIEKLILDLLVQSIHKENVCLSKNKLLKELKMINNNYAFCKIRIPKLSKFMSIEQETIEEWYLSTNSTLKNNLEKALNNLKAQSLIFWSNEISVCKMEVIGEGNGLYNIHKQVFLDEYDEEIVNYSTEVHTISNIREATDDEKKFIIFTEREIMKEMNFKNKQDIVGCGKWDEFKNKVNNIILQKLNIDYYFNSYKILFNQQHVYEKYEELLDLLLSKEEREQHQQELNKAIQERLNENIVKKQNRAINEANKWFGIPGDNNICRRIRDNYLSDNNNLINTLIDIKTKNIKNQIKRTKI